MTFLNHHRTGKLVLTFLTFCCFVSGSFAATGLYIEQMQLGASGESTGKAGIVWLTTDYFRMEEGKTITIGRLDKKLLWYFDANDRTYFEMPLLSDENSGALAKDLFVRTGKTRTIGEWKCYEVRLNPAKRTGWFEAIDSLTLWISDNSYTEAATYFASIFQAMGLDRAKLDTIQAIIGKGFPIEVQIGMLGASNRLRVKKIESRTILPGLFEPLPGYTKQSLDLPVKTK